MNTIDFVKRIELEVTLTGGHQYSSVLPSDSPILHDLYLALAGGAMSDSGDPGILIQLPLSNGHAACTFMSTSVISLTTRPPVLVQPQAVSDARVQIASPSRTPTYVRIDDFLTPDENRQLLDYALVSEADFEGSTVTTAVEGYRKSRVLFPVKDSKWPELFMSRLELHLPHIASTLLSGDFTVTNNEVQLTASNDGDYFKAHSDSGDDTEQTAIREITYVYYFHQEPRPYVGGNLLLYNGRPGDPDYENGKSVLSIAPVNNCLVAFASDQMHEVDVVRCPSAAFADSRFTINGWLSSKPV